jgi:hypothetical protein
MLGSTRMLAKSSSIWCEPPSSPITAGVPTGWTPEYVGPTGDARGTSQGRILYNEFLGDYVYAVATRTYGAGAWTDTRRAADCPAMDAWRQASFTAGHQVFPAPWPLGDCSDQSFGNNDIFSATTGWDRATEASALSRPPRLRRGPPGAPTPGHAVHRAGLHVFATPPARLRVTLPSTRSEALRHANPAHRNRYGDSATKYLNRREA